MSSAKDQTQSEEVSRIFDSYKEHGKVLKAWLAAYSVGSPAFIFSNDYLRDKLLQAGCAKTFLLLVAYAILAQVGITFLNKFVNWINYNASDHSANMNSFIEYLCDSLSKFIYLDLIVDLFSIYFLSKATLILLNSCI